MPNSNLLLDMWYYNRTPWLSLLLLPLSWIFRLLIVLRRAYYRHIVKPQPLSVPVIVVGNINLGGSGKSPLLISLALHLQKLGYSPGVISRGYGSISPHYPFVVTGETPAELAGDEPLMIAQRSACPVVIDADRLAAAKKLIELDCCDIILSDDGLQHYRLPRDLEIVVVDGERGFGNGRLLPAGPLREPASRLRQVDWVAVNGGLDKDSVDTDKSILGWPNAEDTRINMQLHPVNWQRLSDAESLRLDQLPGTPIAKGKVHAVAGIGNPQRFFQSLTALGVDFIPHPFPDHHLFQWSDIDFADDLPVVMTEKDAVKCRNLLKEGRDHGQSDNGLERMKRYWFLSVQAQLDQGFYQALETRLNALPNQRKQSKSVSGERAS